MLKPESRQLGIFDAFHYNTLKNCDNSILDASSGALPCDMYLTGRGVRLPFNRFCFRSHGRRYVLTMSTETFFALGTISAEFAKCQDCKCRRSELDASTTGRDQLVTSSVQLFVYITRIILFIVLYYGLRKQKKNHRGYPPIVK